MRFRQSRSSLIVLLLGLGALSTGCAGGPFGETLQQSLQADPQLEENPPFSSAADSAPDGSAEAQGERQSANLTPEQFAPQPAAGNTAAVPQPGDPEFIGPAPSPDLTSAADANSTAAATTHQAQSPSARSFSDLSQAPAELQSYIEDLMTLTLLSPAPTAESGDGATSPGDQQALFQPNQAITRREYARWLALVNNAFHQDNPAQKIRLAVSTAQPIFQDVPVSDPDFPEIQGLAEAGVIPSSLSGSTTTVTFRPDAPLNREDLILWKTPLDIRQNLPSATLEAVQQTWGFQDAAKIDPRALQAVLADFQNGEFANIRRAFGYTMLFQPDKAVTRAEAAAVLWRFGNQTEGISANNLLPDSRSQNSNAVDRP